MNNNDQIIKSNRASECPIPKTLFKAQSECSAVQCSAVQCSAVQSLGKLRSGLLDSRSRDPWCDGPGVARYSPVSMTEKRKNFNFISLVLLIIQATLSRILSVNCTFFLSTIHKGSDKIRVTLSGQFQQFNDDGCGTSVEM